MCIIIATQDSSKLPSRKTWERCWSANPHGGGVGWVEDGHVHHLKGRMTFKDMWAARKRIPEGVPAVAHFRIRSHGATDADNTHPFVVGGSLFFHNGCLQIPIPTDNKQASDTAYFAESVLSKLPEGFYRDPAFAWVLEQIAGYSSKFVFLDLGGIFIIRPSQGTWDNGVWYSNDSWRAVEYPSVFTPSFSQKSRSRGLRFDPELGGYVSWPSRKADAEWPTRKDREEIDKIAEMCQQQTLTDLRPLSSPDPGSDL